MQKNYGFVRSTQIFFTTLKMFFTNQTKLCKYILMSVLTVTGIILYFSYSHYANTLSIFSNYYWIKFDGSKDELATKIIIFTVDSNRYAGTWGMFINSSWIQDIVSQFWREIYITLFVDLMVTLVIFLFFFEYFTAKGEKMQETRFIRGMRLESNRALVKELNKKKLAGQFYIPAMKGKKDILRIPLTNQFERQHMLIHGTTGSGKGQLFMHMLEQIEAAEDKIIIYDKGCTFTRYFYKKERGDIILNPFDDRCANWDMWLDAPKYNLLDNMAAALIPQHMGAADPFWVNAARVIFTSVADTLATGDAKKRTMENLMKILIIGKLSKLSSLLKGTEAATLSDETLQKMATSIRSILVTYCRSLRYMVAVNNKNAGQPKFSIRNWLQDTNNKGWLFISCRDEEKEVLKPLITLWLDSAVSALMSMPEDYKGRKWFLYDEVPSLQKLPSLNSGLSEIRKFGGCMMLGMQSFAQLQSIYGRDEAQAIFSLLNTRLYFRSPDAESAKLVSMELGEQDVEEVIENYSYGTNNIRDGISLATQRVTRRLVEFAEVIAMGDLEFYLREIGDLPVTLVKLFKKINRVERASAFVPFEPENTSDAERAFDKKHAETSDEERMKQIQALNDGKEPPEIVKEKEVSQKPAKQKKGEKPSSGITKEMQNNLKTKHLDDGKLLGD